MKAFNLLRTGLKLIKRLIYATCLMIIKLIMALPVIQRYYIGLAVQAKFLYRQSELFKLRWKELGLKFAEESFKGDAMFFFDKAKKEPWIIKKQILLDAIMKKKPQGYYI